MVIINSSGPLCCSSLSILHQKCTEYLKSLKYGEIYLFISIALISIRSISDQYIMHEVFTVTCSHNNLVIIKKKKKAEGKELNSFFCPFYSSLCFIPLSTVQVVSFGQGLFLQGSQGPSYT